MEIKKYQNRRHLLMLYPQEDKTHKNALEYIIQNYEKYVYICHDKDTDENGELKKAHTHCIIEFPSARWNTAVAKELCITPNYIIEPEFGFDNCLEYLIHHKQKDKFQYSIDDCNGTLVGKLKDLLNKGTKSECEKVIDILNYIDDSKKYLSYSELIRYCCDIGVYDVLRRSGALIVKCLDEHNYKPSKVKRSHIDNDFDNDVLF